MIRVQRVAQARGEAEEILGAVDLEGDSGEGFDFGTVEPLPTDLALIAGGKAPLVEGEVQRGGEPEPFENLRQHGAQPEPPAPEDRGAVAQVALVSFQPAPQLAGDVFHRQQRQLMLLVFAPDQGHVALVQLLPEEGQGRRLLGGHLLDDRARNEQVDRPIRGKLAPQALAQRGLSHQGQVDQ